MNIGQKLLAREGIKAPKRVLVVKQEVHNDLYYAGNTAEEIVYSSIHRSGPVGLFTALNADFAVVKVDAAPECNVWRQKVTDCKHNPVEYYERFKGEIKRYRQGFDHSRVAVSVDEINWGLYDLVISIDIAVPTRIVQANPHMVWAYYVSEPCMSLYAASLAEPQFGYDLFFTLGFQPERPAYPSPRVLEFPYFLQYVGCFTDLDGITNPSFDKRRGVSVETHSLKLWDETQAARVEGEVGPVYRGFFDLRTKIANLRASKFHIRTDGKAIWGNSLIEAMACGALVVVTPTLLKHRLVAPDLVVRDFDAMLVTLRALEEDTPFRDACAWQQEAMLNEICFIRPMRDLAEALERL
jgi:hypothetical protein